MTQKRIFLLVIMAGLLLAACAPVVKQANPETQELQIRAWAKNGEATKLTVTLANGEEVTASASSFVWYYDVPVDQTEYLVDRDMYYLHLWESKAPSQ